MRKIILAGVVALGMATVVGCCGGDTKPTNAPAEKKPEAKPTGCSSGGCGSKPAADK